MTSRPLGPQLPDGDPLSRVGRSQPPALPGPKPPERVDLAERRRTNRENSERREQALAAGQRRSKRGGKAGYLEALGSTPGRPLLPDAEFPRRWSPELADAIDGLRAVESQARIAAQRWDASLPGNPDFTAAVEAERESALRQLDRGEDHIEPGPLHVLLTEGEMALYLEAIHAEARAVWADRQVRDLGAKLEPVFDGQADEIRDRMRDLLTRARDHRDRRSYDAFTDLAPDWSDVVSLFKWSRSVDRPFKRRHRKFPAELGMLEFEAAVAVGEYRPEVPIEGTRVG
jgi:hypothetical protein